MKLPEKIELKAEAAEALLARLSEGNLDLSDHQMLSQIVRAYVWLQGTLLGTKMSLARLRHLFGLGSQTEKRRYLHGVEGVSPLAGRKGVKGHGRLGHEAYTGAETVERRHETLQAGDGCPRGCGGRVYSLEPRALIQLKGHGLASATRTLLERLRCSVCGEVFTASLAPGVSYQKYDASLKAHLAINKTYAGQPFHRIERLQSMVGVPLPDATQWQLVESLADAVYPVYRALERLASQGELICHDDTRVSILSLKRASQGQKRQGQYTTGIMAQVGERQIALFISGACHSGENMTKLMAYRSQGLPPVIRMSDALSCNLAVTFAEILAHCLAHGRRKFYEIYDYFPGPCGRVIDVLASVYHHEALCKGMTKEERLVYHQVHSHPLLEGLKGWMEGQLQDRHVEPNSRLGKAFQYMLRHWQKLTRFLEVAGCPLDNNITERALKIPIRVRKNSLFHKSEHGAFVGGMLSSVIHTCVLAGENPVDYLIALEKHRSLLLKAPEDWLPWTYRQTMGARASPKAA